MIKRFSLLIFFCFMHTSHADQLSGAIHASDLQKVTALLSASTVTTEQLAKYFDTAEQVIRTRRNKMDAKIRSSDDYRISNKTGIAGCIAIACLIGMPVSAAGSIVTEHYNDTYLKCFLGSTMGFTISMVATTIYSELDKEVYRKHLQNLYKDAVRIKELLYDYEISLSNTSNL